MAKKIVAANWKMNNDEYSSKSLAYEFLKLLNNHNNPQITTILCVPFPFLATINLMCQGAESVFVGAQNCSSFSKGAFTGEVSVKLLNSLGVSSVIIGHSERRNYFNETNDIIEKKISNCIKYDVTPILCFGENLNERKKGNFLNVIESQINILNSFKKIDHEIILAYEPVWAIGSGLTPSVDEINEVHFFVKNKFPKLKILYGGSLNFNNAKDILSLHNVDGGLVGGASLDPSSFSSIIHSIK